MSRQIVMIGQLQFSNKQLDGICVHATCPLIATRISFSLHNMHTKTAKKPSPRLYPIIRKQMNMTSIYSYNTV